MSKQEKELSGEEKANLKLQEQQKAKALSDIPKMSDRVLKGQVHGKGAQPKWYKDAVHAELKSRKEKHGKKAGAAAQEAVHAPQEPVKGEGESDAAQPE